MKNTPLTLNFGSVRLPVSTDGLLHAGTVQAQLGLHMAWEAVLVEHALPEIYRDFGSGPEAALTVPDFVTLAFALDTPEARRWLAARLESADARRALLSTVSRHGGRGAVYGQLGSISNRAVLGKESASVRQERGVRATRDGLSSTELLRLAYIDTVTARAIEEQAVSGNAAILRLHQQVAQQEGRSWQASQAM